MNAIEPLLWMGCVYVLIRIIKTGNLRLWIGFGLLAGFILLTSPPARAQSKGGLGLSPACPRAPPAAPRSPCSGRRAWRRRAARRRRSAG